MVYRKITEYCKENNLSISALKNYVELGTELLESGSKEVIHLMRPCRRLLEQRLFLLKSC